MRITNHFDPPDVLSYGGGTDSDGFPPAPEPVDLNFAPVSKRSKAVLDAVGINKVEDYRDCKSRLTHVARVLRNEPPEGRGAGVQHTPFDPLRAENVSSDGCGLTKTCTRLISRPTTLSDSFECWTSRTG